MVHNFFVGYNKHNQFKKELGTECLKLHQQEFVTNREPIKCN